MEVDRALAARRGRSRRRRPEHGGGDGPSTAAAASSTRMQSKQTTSSTTRHVDHFDAGELQFFLLLYFYFLVLGLHIGLVKIVGFQGLIN
jgi:hypothetical protein